MSDPTIPPQIPHECYSALLLIIREAKQDINRTANSLIKIGDEYQIQTMSLAGIKLQDHVKKLTWVESVLLGKDFKESHQTPT